MATKITETDNLNSFSSPPPGGWALERPNIKVRVKVTAKKGGTTHNENVDQDVSLIGPGDIIGIDQNLVIKTEPVNWITNFEPNYFPHIEFYEEDFPWRYSPANPNGQKLRPWLVLVALKASEFERDSALFGSLPSIRIIGHVDDAPGTTGAASRVFPNPAQTWAWSHVHMNGDLDPTDLLDPNNSAHVDTALVRFRSLLQSNPDQAYSRMICPRKLDPFTTYHCFLLPAYEVGRLAGLGADETLLAVHEAQKASFGAPHLATGDHLIYVDHYPIYYEWQFMTGDIGDFESLVRKLKPIEVDQRVGRRPIDIQDPGFNVGYTGTVYGDGTLLLEGALLPPLTVPPPPGALTRYQYPWNNGTPTTQYRRRLADLLNLSEDLQEATFPPSQFHGTNPFGYTTGSTDIEDDPILTPDIYGRWHSLQKRVSHTFVGRWLDELNLDPRNRVAASIGVKYVKKHQERLMDRAWDQLGDVIEANRKLRWGQFSQWTAQAGYNKHIKNQPTEQAAAMTGKMFSQVKTSGVAASKVVADSRMPNVAQSTSYRKVERPMGPLMRRMDPNHAVFTQNNLRVNLAGNALAPVSAKTFSSEYSRMPRTNIDSDVTTIVNYSVGSPIYAPIAPNTYTVVPDYDSEVRFKTAVDRYKEYFENDNWPDVNPGNTLTLSTVTNTVVTNVAPVATVAKAVYAGLEFQAVQGFVLPPPMKIVPVMAYPVFRDATYEAVKDLGVDYFVPNLKMIPENSITLLESNQRFVEAFMVGLNHEMGRELLWREYPTDQRGSYFRQFWDSLDAVNTSGLSEKDHALANLDIDEIHTWSTGALGTHSPRPGDGHGLLVLVIRGELLKKFPNTVIFAQKAKFKAGGNNNVDPRELDTEIRTPLFSAFVGPDIYFIGFNLTAAQAKGARPTDPGWFFVIHERPGEIRFGVDATSSGALTHWDKLWTGNAPFVNGHLSANDNAVTASTSNVISGKAVNWGFNSTNLAQILYQNPVLLAVHAEEMIA